MAPAHSDRALFFDLDGTLTDPKPGITGCIQYALERLDRPVPTQDELLWCIGPPLHQSFARLVGEPLAWRGVELYRERYGDVGLFENEVYTGIPEALETLGAEVRLFVASSKPKVYVDRILDHFGLAPYFEAVFGSELDGTRTDKRALLPWALDRAGVSSADAVMIGDRAQDGVGARHAGMPFVGVLYGYGSETELREAGAERLVATPSGLIGGAAI